MAEGSFLESDPFRSILEEYYPTGLQATQDRHRAYREELRPYSRAAEMAAEAVRKVIVALLATRCAGRFCCRLDRENLTKSPQSIDEKIFRYLSGAGVARQKPTNGLLRTLRENRHDSTTFLRLFFRDLPDVMNDLARFRVVTNFITDAQSVGEEFLRGGLGAYGIVVEPNVEDRIEADRWEEGASGHRAIHVYLQVPTDDGKLRVEVQVITLLEYGWDQKAHLLYELTRRGEAGGIDKRTKLKARAVSDALYVADVLFDELLDKAFPGRVK